MYDTSAAHVTRSLEVVASSTDGNVWKICFCTFYVPEGPASAHPPILFGPSSKCVSLEGPFSHKTSTKAPLWNFTKSLKRQKKMQEIRMQHLCLEGPLGPLGFEGAQHR